ncbi:probable xyloglucan endotransglucosylase/hydrolase protein 6, partial [Tanacetum coccineum]
MGKWGVISSLFAAPLRNINPVCVLSRMAYGEWTENNMDFRVTWSDSHIKQHDGGKGIQVLDQNSGCGFASKSQYLFGGVSLMIKLIPGESMKIKLIPRDFAGTVTAFYVPWSNERPLENKELNVIIVVELSIKCRRQRQDRKQDRGQKQNK